MSNFLEILGKKNTEGEPSAESTNIEITYIRVDQGDDHAMQD